MVSWDEDATVRERDFRRVGWIDGFVAGACFVAVLAFAGLWIASGMGWEALR
jgi:hypothetical protein